jgi:hypothetical protein
LIGLARTIVVVIEPDHHHDDDLYDENWFFDPDDLDPDDLEPVPPPPWRQPLLIAVAALTAVALAIVPLYNVIAGSPVSDSGLEICGFDYCIVQEAVGEAGLNSTMSRLSHTFLDEDDARALANELADYLGIPPVGLRVVDRIEGRIGGFYDPVDRVVEIESPARAWTVLHEVAHAVETGHGPAFQQVVIELTAYLESAAG